MDVPYANAYQEVLEILKYIPKEDYQKIPKEKLNCLKPMPTTSTYFHTIQKKL